MSCNTKFLVPAGAAGVVRSHGTLLYFYYPSPLPGAHWQQVSALAQADSACPDLPYHTPAEIGAPALRSCKRKRDGLEGCHPRSEAQES